MLVRACVRLLLHSLGQVVVTGSPCRRRRRAAAAAAAALSMQNKEEGRGGEMDNVRERGRKGYYIHNFVVII